MTTIRHPLALTIVLSLSICACDTEEASEEAAPEEEVLETTPEEVAVEAPAPAPAAAEPEVDLAPPAEGGTTTLLSLREGFAADSAAWTGQRVTVRALFMSATSVGGRPNNISLIVSQDDYAEDRLRHAMMCSFGDDAPESVNLTQYAEVTVRGTVVERFGRAGLDDCEIVTD